MIQIVRMAPLEGCGRRGWMGLGVQGLGGGVGNGRKYEELVYPLIKKHWNLLNPSSSFLFVLSGL